MVSILGDNNVVNDVLVSSIVVKTKVSQFQGGGGSLDSGESISTVTGSTPVWERTSSVERNGQFVVTSVTNQVLEGTGSVVVACGGQLTLEDWVSSLKVVSVAAKVHIDLVLAQEGFNTVGTKTSCRINRTVTNSGGFADAGEVGRRRVRGTVHGTVTNDNDPGSFLTVLVGFDQVLFQPVERSQEFILGTFESTFTVPGDNVKRLVVV